MGYRNQARECAAAARRSEKCPAVSAEQASAAFAFLSTVVSANLVSEAVS
jgi:hypothetical protein